MQRSTFALASRRLALAAAVAAVGLAATACSDDNGNGTGPTIPRMYNQVQRLGQSARERGAAVEAEPSDARLDRPRSGRRARRRPRWSDFLTTVAGPGSGLHPGHRARADSRHAGRATRARTRPATAGWLTWLPQLGDGYGGRKLRTTWSIWRSSRSSATRSATPAHATPQLTTDNVGIDSPNVTTTFPYLAPPN